MASNFNSFPNAMFLPRLALGIALLTGPSALPALPLQHSAMPASSENAVQSPAPENHAAYPDYVLAPFSGNYQVFRGGKPLGNATMRLSHSGGQRWRIDLAIRGTQGLAGMAGFNIQQSTVFDEIGAQYRPISQSTVQGALFSSRRTTGLYDWNALTASWTGDVKKSRRGRKIELQPGDMSGLLINLALMRDARPGRQLSYRFVDDSRLRTYQYNTAAAPENIQIGDVPYSALRVERSNGGNDETRVWVTPDVPLPVRIYMKDNDADAIDLLLIDYKGA